LIHPLGRILASREGVSADRRIHQSTGLATVSLLWLERELWPQISLGGERKLRKGKIQSQPDVD